MALLRYSMLADLSFVGVLFLQCVLSSPTVAIGAVESIATNNAPLNFSHPSHQSVSNSTDSSDLGAANSFSNFESEVATGARFIYNIYNKNAQLYSIDIVFSDPPAFEPIKDLQEPDILSTDMTFYLPPATTSGSSPAPQTEIHSIHNFLAPRSRWTVMDAKKGVSPTKTRQFFLGVLASLSLAKAWQIAMETHFVGWWDTCQILQYQERRAPVYRFSRYDGEKEGGGDWICEIDSLLRDPDCRFEPMKFVESVDVGPGIGWGNVTEMATA